MGCQSLQKGTFQRSAQCGALCAQAREAREQGNTDEANNYINEAIRQRPNDIETRRQLAETMWTNGRRDEAVAHFMSLCALQPKDAKLAARLAVMQWETNHKAAAASTAIAVLQLDPQSKEALLIKARNEVKHGQLDEALLTYLRLSQVAPDNLSAYGELGELYLKRGQPDRACPLFQTAFQHPQATADQRVEMAWLLGVAYAQCERWPLAVTILEQAIERRQSTADDWCFLGLARLQMGDLGGAHADLDRARECDPDCLAARKLARQLEIAADTMPSKSEITPVSHLENDRTLR